LLVHLPGLLASWRSGGYSVGVSKNKALVLQVLQAAKQPLNAAQVHELCGFGPDLATIYRNLRGLEAEGIADSFVFDCSDRGTERYYLLHRVEHTHFFHCENCHNFFSFPGCPMETFIDNLEQEKGFRIHQHYITLTGSCADCRSKTDVARH